MNAALAYALLACLLAFAVFKEKLLISQTEKEHAFLAYLHVFVGASDALLTEGKFDINLTSKEAS